MQFAEVGVRQGALTRCPHGIGFLGLAWGSKDAQTPLLTDAVGCLDNEQGVPAEALTLPGSALQHAKEVVRAAFKAAADEAADPLDACLAAAQAAEPVRALVSGAHVLGHMQLAFMLQGLPLATPRVVLCMSYSSCALCLLLSVSASHKQSQFIAHVS